MCLYFTVPQADVLPAGLRSEPVTCLLSPHTWGRGCSRHTYMHYCQSYALLFTPPRPPSTFQRICRHSFALQYQYSDLFCMSVCCQVGSRELVVQPWAADKPSFTAELSRIITYITNPQVGCTEHGIKHSTAVK